jgi:hypothetical protein
MAVILLADSLVLHLIVDNVLLKKKASPSFNYHETAIGLTLNHWRGSMAIGQVRRAAVGKRVIDVI